MRRPTGNLARGLVRQRPTTIGGYLPVLSTEEPRYQLLDVQIKEDNWPRIACELRLSHPLTCSLPSASIELALEKTWNLPVRAGMSPSVRYPHGTRPICR